MLDLHPVTEERVEAARGEIVGVIREPDFIGRDLPNAEARLKQAIAEGLYAPEAEVEFDVLQHFDTADELLEAKEEHVGAQASLVRRIRATQPPFVLREHVVLRRLRALPGLD
jgi:hypothetical protein